MRKNRGTKGRGKHHRRGPIREFGTPAPRLLRWTITIKRDISCLVTYLDCPPSAMQDPTEGVGGGEKGIANFSVPPMQRKLPPPSPVVLHSASNFRWTKKGIKKNTSCLHMYILGLSYPLDIKY